MNRILGKDCCKIRSNLSWNFIKKILGTLKEMKKSKVISPNSPKRHS